MSAADFLADVALCNKSKHESIPPGFVLLEKTLQGSDVNLSKTGFHLMVRRGSGPHRDTYVVSDIILVRHGHDPVPIGYVPLLTSVGGHTGYLNKSKTNVVCCVKKEARNTIVRAVYTLQVIRTSKKESCPLGYIQLPLNLNEGSSQNDACFLCIQYLDVQQSPAVTIPAQQVVTQNLPILGARGTRDPSGSSIKPKTDPSNPLQRQTSISPFTVPIVLKRSGAGTVSTAPIAIARQDPTIAPCTPNTREEIVLKYNYTFEIERAIAGSC